MVQQAGLWMVGSGQQTDRHLAEHLPLPDSTRPCQTHETSPNMTGRTGILAPADNSATVRDRDLGH